MPLSFLGTSTLASTSFASVSHAAAALSHPTVDAIVLFVLIAGGLFYGIIAGRRKIVSSLLLTYVAIAIFPTLPIEKLALLSGTRDSSVISMAAFIILFVLLVLFLGARRRGFGQSSTWWQIFSLSFLQMGLLIHTVLGFLPPEKSSALAPFTRSVFANPTLHIWWLVVPILALAVIRRLIHRDE